MEKVKIELAGGVLQSGRLDKISYLLLLLTLFAAPIFFIPSAFYPLQFAKTFFISTAVIISLALWIIARLKDGKIIFPGSSIMIGVGAVLIAVFLSSFFSGSFFFSFMGNALEAGTLGSVLVMFSAFFLMPVFFPSKEKIFYAYLAFFIGFFILSVFHLLRFAFGADFLSFGVFKGITGNVLGKWNDLGIFFGLGAALSLVTIEFIDLSRFFKFLIYAVLAIALVFLAIINFSTVWYAIGAFSLIFTVYLISFGRKEKLSGEGESSAPVPLKKRIPYSSIAVLAVSLVFIFAGVRIGNYLSNSLGISELEVRPSWSATFEVAGNTLGNHPVFGAGPNNFSGEWLLYKPQGINNTVFWGTDFNYGIGLIPTFLSTTGVLGILAWLFFLCSFLYLGGKAVLSSPSDKFLRYLLISSFVASLFLWTFNIVYIPNTALIFMTFAFSGLFVSALSLAGIVKIKSVSGEDNPRTGFASVLVLVSLLIFFLGMGYGIWNKFFSSVYLQKGLSAWNAEGNVDKAEKYFKGAQDFSATDAGYRFLSEIGLVRMNNILSKSGSGASPEALRTEFQAVLADAIRNSKEAVNVNGRNYENWMELGRVYEAVVPLKIEGAYESSLSAYNEALKRNPQNPAIYLTMARLESAKGDNAKSKENVSKALSLKNNYTEAIFFLSQIQAKEGNLKEAISSVEAASIISPDDPAIFFQLGLLLYNNKEYKKAVTALEKALALNPSYANAKYFLGLSYDKTGNDEGAIAQFASLKETNPDNAEVASILKNLKAGRSPFYEASDDKPEKRSKLPISDTDSSDEE